VHPVEFETSFLDLESNVWSTGLLIPRRIAEEIIKTSGNRVLCTLNGKVTYPCGILTKATGEFFVNISKENRKKAGIGSNQTIHVSLEPDQSKYGMPMPDELRAAMDIEMEGTKYFDLLTPGKQRSLIYLVSKPKSAEVRIKKALVILQYLEEVNGQLDFKELNLAFKEANRT
jgi:hypothetical protein